MQKRKEIPDTQSIINAIDAHGMLQCVAVSGRYVVVHVALCCYIMVAVSCSELQCVVAVTQLS